MNELLKNIEKLHTTELGATRITKNLSLNATEPVSWCRGQILRPDAQITRRGKNWYICAGGCIITVNAHSYTIITAHKTAAADNIDRKM